MAEAIAIASLQTTENVAPQPSDHDAASINEDEPPTDANTHQTIPQETSSAEAADGGENRGQLIADASCAPADIRYPTDVSLLNEAREKTEELIDALHEPLVGKEARPRTYRVKARRAFVAFTKRKKPSRRKIRQAKRQQLGFLRRNFQALDRLLEHPDALPPMELSRRQYKNLLVCRELYRQQLEMYNSNSQRIDDRIVSIAQPHVRPIKRGKAGRDTEFGAKLSLSVVDGFSFC